MATRIGIISDTHNVLSQEVIEVLKTCEYILHAGDITEESVLDQIRFLGRIYVVRGNCDGSWAGYLKKKLLFEIEGIHFLMVHNRKDVGKDLNKADVVIYGHTHRFHKEKKEGKLWLNPGSCGISRFGGELSLAVMTVDEKGYKVEKVILA